MNKKIRTNLLIYVEWQMQVEFGNYDSFYEAGVVFSPDQVTKYIVITIRNII